MCIFKKNYTNCIATQQSVNQTNFYSAMCRRRLRRLIAEATFINSDPFMFHIKIYNTF